MIVSKLDKIADLPLAVLHSSLAYCSSSYELTLLLLSPPLCIVGWLTKT